MKNIEKIEESSRISQMILQVGLGVETVEQVAVEVVEAVGADEELELLIGYGRPDLEGEAVLGAVKVLHTDVGCSRIEQVDE